MSVIFADVTDITIPEGSVTKIEETSGLKRVLWEKKTEKSYTLTIRATNVNGYDEDTFTITIQ